MDVPFLPKEISFSKQTARDLDCTDVSPAPAYGWRPPKVSTLAAAKKQELPKIVWGRFQPWENVLSLSNNQQIVRRGHSAMVANLPILTCTRAAPPLGLFRAKSEEWWERGRTKLLG